MIRILHVIGAMDRGGAETMIMNLYRAIDRSRIQFDFLVHEERPCDYDEEIQNLGGRLFRIPRFVGTNVISYRRVCREFFAAHSEHSIVHGHIGSCAAVYLSEAKRAGRVTIAHSHGQNFPVSVMELGFRVLSYPTRFVADQFLACSLEAGRDRFGSKVVQGNAFHIVRNAIDVGAYACDEASHASAKQALGFADAPVIGHVGRFDPVKNHPFLLEVFAEIIRRVPEAKLVLVGRGPSEGEVRHLVQQAHLADSVVFFGVTDQVAEVLKALDVFVFPSFAEGLSMAAVEAQTAGVPCVLSTGVPELAIVSPDTIAHLPLDAGAQTWADEAVRLMSGPVDRAAGARAARSSGYDIAETVVWLEQYYCGLQG